MDMNNGTGGTEFKPAATLTGTVTGGRPGPQLGSVDIGVSHEAYLFRVALPGLSKNQGDLKCRIQLDGSVQIRGMRLPCSDFLSSFPGEFQLRVQDLSPSGPFRICFKLPGPVEPRLCVPSYRDGILEGVVMKCRMPSAAPPASQQTA
ncbi:Increased DNA methylation 3 [Linum grandiflorum]